MRALINKKNDEDVITETMWQEWFGPNGEALTGYMGYRLVDDYIPAEVQALPPEETEPPAAADPEPATVPDEKQQRIAALEQELAALRQTS